MHACGHDIHMTSWIGAATLLVQAKDQWRGTLVFIGQPAEETVVGARAMLGAGLYQKVPKPDFALAIHDKAELPAGKIGIVKGYALANVDSVDVYIYGRGGHGAFPHKTVDPVVIGARTVVALQTLVSRENNPFDPAVVTVGSFQAGNKYNIIPDDAHLQLTVRSYKPEVRERLIKGIERIAKAEAAAAGAEKEPKVSIAESANATYNDPQLTDRLAAALAARFGAQNVVTVDPVMGAEDFGEFGRAAKAPSVMLQVGAVEPGRFAQAEAKGETLPPLHSSAFAPDRERTIKTGVGTLVASALELLGKR
jgi:hippurate hydrolase